MGWCGSRLLQDNVLWKPPGGKTLAYHQDAAYDDWIIPQTMMTCWMPIDNVDKEKGTLEYVKGSHLWVHFQTSNSTRQVQYLFQSFH